MGIPWTSPSHAERFPNAAKPWRRIAIGAAFGAGAAMLAVGFLVVGRAAVLVRAEPTVAAVALALATSGLEAVRAEFLLRGVVLRALQNARISGLGKVLACGLMGAMAAAGDSSATLPSVFFDGALGLGFGALWVHDRGVWMAWSAHTAWAFATGLLLQGGLFNAQVASSWWGGNAGPLRGIAGTVAVLPIAIVAIAWVTLATKRAPVVR
jgi:hypothetical protein